MFQEIIAFEETLQVVHPLTRKKGLTENMAFYQNNLSNTYRNIPKPIKTFCQNKGKQIKTSVK